MFVELRRLGCTPFYNFVKQHNCIICGQKPDPHHLTAVGIGGGVGEDLTCVPVCRVHHTIAHGMTVADFNDEFNTDLWRECHRVLLNFIKQHESFTIEDNITSLKLIPGPKRNA